MFHSKSRFSFLTKLENGVLIDDLSVKSFFFVPKKKKKKKLLSFFMN